MPFKRSPGSKIFTPIAFVSISLIININSELFVTKSQSIRDPVDAIESLDRIVKTIPPLLLGAHGYLLITKPSQHRNIIYGSLPDDIPTHTSVVVSN